MSQSTPGHDGPFPHASLRGHSNSPWAGRPDASDRTRELSPADLEWIEAERLEFRIDIAMQCLADSGGPPSTR